MSYQALARSWRPRGFSELVGQTHVRTALENALGRGKLHPALLFSGTRGVGKTTLARIIARCLNCEQGISATPCGECGICREIDAGRFVDLIEVDAASRTKVDETRELLDNVPYSPARGRYKVYLIDEVHMLSKHSFNAILKTLEEPPPHVQFLFATTDPNKLPVTILSRCLQFHLKRIAPDAIGWRIREILDAESIAYDDDGIARLARAANGSLRDGLSLLDQAIAYGDGRVEGPAVAQMLGTIERRDLLRLATAVADADAGAAWAAIDGIDEQGLDFAEVLDELCRLWQRLAVGQQVPAVLDEAEQADLGPLLERFPAADLQVYYQIALNARRDLDWAPDPRSGFEMTILRTLAFLPEAPGGGGAKQIPAATAPAAGPAADPAAHAAAPTAAPATGTAPAAARTGNAATPADWPALRGELALSGAVQRVADASEALDFDERAIRLRVGAGAAALCTPGVERQLREAVQGRLGRACELVLEKAETPAAPAGGDPEAEFLAHPDVSRAVELFSAELQPGSLRLAADDDSQTIN